MIAALTMKRYGLGPLIACGGVLFFLLALVLVVAANAFLARDFVNTLSGVSHGCEDGAAVVPPAAP